MQLSCAFATDSDSARNCEVAEELGFHRAWLYDVPQQGADVWMMLGAAAERTSRIGLGPGVLVPSLRHPMVNAAATATLCARAPGRVAVAFGTGFTGRRAMGLPPVTWAFMEAYIRAYQGLLRGEVVEWEGARQSMLHPQEGELAPPIDVPVLISALGPKGCGVAKMLGADGLFGTLQVPVAAAEHEWVPFLAWGTVLDDGEQQDSEHARTAGGPGWALALHGAYEMGGADAVAQLPGGTEWLDTVARTAEVERHLAVHDRHGTGLNAADRAAWDAGGHVSLRETTLTGTRTEVRDKLAAYADQGVTEMVFQPCGSDIRRELERFMDAAG